MLSRRTERFGASALAEDIEVFNENGETQQLKLFPSEVEPPADDPDVAQVQLQKYGWNAHGSLGPAIWAGSYSSD